MTGVPTIDNTLSRVGSLISAAMSAAPTRVEKKMIPIIYKRLY